MVAVFRSSTSMQWFQQDQELTEVCEKKKNKEQGEKFKTEKNAPHLFLILEKN